MSPRKMHPDEPDIDARLVRKLLSAHAPYWAGLAVSAVPSSGTDNALFRLGQDKVVRMPRTAWAAPLIEREHAWLPRLAPHLPLAVPEALLVGPPAGGYPWPWGVYGWIQGEEAAPGNLADPGRAAADLARFLVVLHRQDASGGPPSGPDNFYRGVPLRQRDQPVREAIEALAGSIETAPVVEAWQQALSAPEHDGPPRLLHGDVRPGNLLARDGRLAAVIDFGCLGVGDPACDLQVAWNFFPAGAREVFRQELGVDAAAWERGKGWALSVALIALPYYQESNPRLADIARHTVQEVLA